LQQTFSSKEKLYQKNFVLLRKNGVRVFILALLGGEGIGNPEGGF